MRAIDTNLVVRYLVPADDPSQAARAARVIDGGEVFVPSTVLLETEWVLRTFYGFSGADVASAFKGFAGLESVQVEHPLRLRRALEWLLEGMDFADALHLASADHCEAFVTFDKAFLRAAKTISSVPVRTP